MRRTGRCHWHYQHLEAAACSWLGLGLELAEGLGGLGEGVGKGLVPVHLRAVCAEFLRALIAQGLRHDQADQLSSRLRLGHVGFGGTQDDRGGFGPGGGKRALPW